MGVRAIIVRWLKRSSGRHWYGYGTLNGYGTRGASHGASGQTRQACSSSAWLMDCGVSGTRCACTTAGAASVGDQAPALAYPAANPGATWPADRPCGTNPSSAAAPPGCAAPIPAAACTGEACWVCTCSIPLAARIVGAERDGARLRAESTGAAKAAELAALQTGAGAAAFSSGARWEGALAGALMRAAPCPLALGAAAACASLLPPWRCRVLCGSDCMPSCCQG